MIDSTKKDHLNGEQTLNLRHICRETIRKHLLNLDPHTHLFDRMPRLGLPSLLTRYLLYYKSLDDDVDGTSNGDSAAIETPEEIILAKSVHRANVVRHLSTPTSSDDIEERSSTHSRAFLFSVLGLAEIELD